MFAMGRFFYCFKCKGEKMNKKVLLTSFVVMGMTVNVYAETFPNDGYMLQNRVYEDAATYENMGVYDGDVTAMAEYVDIIYQVAAGKYLPAGKIVASECPAGSFCSGLKTTYNETEDQGIQSCPAEFANSVAGAPTASACYTSCEIADVEHATAVSGDNYFGDGIDTCQPTECHAGWHVQPGVNLREIIGNAAGVRAAYRNNSGWFGEHQASLGPGAYSINDNNSFEVNYGENGTIVGHARCASIVNVGYMGAGIFDDGYFGGSGDLHQYLSDDTGADGENCFCRVEGYTPVGGTQQTVMGSWAYLLNSGAENCASYCASSCASWLRKDVAGSIALRDVVFGAAGNTLASCQANTINITWTDANDEDIAANNAGTCEYSGDVRTPRKAVDKIGKRFIGWKFMKTAGN